MDPTGSCFGVHLGGASWKAVEPLESRSGLQKQGSRAGF